MNPRSWLIPALIVAIAASAVVAIVSAPRADRRLHWVAKPLATLLVLALALAIPPNAHSARWLIAAALVCSWVGDVLLMLPRDRFAGGLAAFLLAHLLYITAFSIRLPRPHPLLGVMLAAPFVQQATGYFPRIPRALRAPVIAYVLALSAMAWLAIERAAAGLPGGRFAAVGATLFLISDSVLAIDRFHRHFRGAHTLVLGTYFSAQTLLALSLSR